MNMTDPSLIDDLLKKLEGNGINNIAQRLNIAPEQADQAVRSALPEIVKTIQNTKATDISHSLMDHLASSGQHGVASIRSKIGAMFSSAEDANTAAQPEQNNGLGEGVMSLLGHRAESVTQTISKASGLGQSQITALVGMIAPTVLGFIGKQSIESSDPAETADKLQSSAHESYESLKSNAQHNAQQIKDKAEEGIDRLKSSAEDHLDGLKAKAADHTEQLKSSATESKDSIGGKITHMLDMDGDGKLGLGDLIQAGNTLLGRKTNAEANNKRH